MQILSPKDRILLVRHNARLPIFTQNAKILCCQQITNLGKIEDGSGNREDCFNLREGARFKF